IPRQHQAIAEKQRQERDLCVNNTVLLPVSLGTLLWMAVHSHPKQCAYSEAHRLSPIVKHTQNIVNPFDHPSW
ncbi:unnamed protein product, partial [Staurois parvus]